VGAADASTATHARESTLRSGGSKDSGAGRHRRPTPGTAALDRNGQGERARDLQGGAALDLEAVDVDQHHLPATELIDTPPAREVHILVVGYSDYSNANLTVSSSVASSGGNRSQVTTWPS